MLWAIRIAEAMIVTPTGSRTPFFSDTARGFVVGVILHVISFHEEDDHNLPFVRDLIVRGYQVFDDNGVEMTKGREAHDLLLRKMQRNTAYSGAISGAAAAITSAGGETAGNVRATLQEQTKWLDIPEVRHALRSSSFNLADLKTRKDVVFSVVAPVFSIREELAPQPKTLRLF